ncbi:gas vesicle protein GvpK [Isoptericola sp. NPDC019693]|uniref:gas vesicle protein GvpK n=1 Tax=Isoptericola sp. NPDC019693 TaxID=3364009 RepID=UPI0037B3E6F1
MTLTIDEHSLKNGVLTLVVTLVEVIQEALEGQALRRLEGGELTEEEQERLGQALLDLDDALESIKADHGLTASVADLRRGLDDVVDDVLDKLVNPSQWVEDESGGTPRGRA